MSHDVAVLGVGMHPWGKWGRSFVSYGVHAAREALNDSDVPWGDVDLVVGGETVRNGYAGYVAGATFAQALGWNGARVATSYAACATGAQALDTARARILAGMSEVALVVGADTTPKGFLAPNAGERWDDPDWLRFRLLGMTNPGYFALYARRRMDLYGATQADFAEVKVKNARHGLNNPNARYRKEVSADDVLNSAVVSDPLHLLDICATSDGAAAVVLTSMDYAKRHGLAEPVRVRAISTVTPTFPNTVIDMPLLSTEPATPAGTLSGGNSPRPSSSRSGPRPTRRPASGPTRSAWPRSTTSRPPWSSTGSRTSRCASRVRPSSSCARVTPPSGAGSRSIRAAGWPVSVRPSPPRRWPRCARSPGSCAAGPTAGRSRTRRSGSRPTRVCSATDPRSS